jgi:hypothetical protein
MPHPLRVPGDVGPVPSGVSEEDANEWEAAVKEKQAASMRSGGAGYFRKRNLSADCVTNGGEYVDQLARRWNVAHQRHMR